MLPNDILGIIKKYNEHDKGFFFHLHNLVYWSNGTEYQKWCEAPFTTTDRANMYYKNGYLQAVQWIYKNSKWHHTNDFHVETKVIISLEIHTLIDITVGRFELYDKNGNKMIIPSKNQPDCGMYCLVWNSTLYYFSIAYCEKYDFISWSKFSTPKFSNSIGQCYFCNDFFYIIENITYNIHIYDPKKDLWTRGFIA